MSSSSSQPSGKELEPNSHQDEAEKLRAKVIELQQKLIGQLYAEIAARKKKYAEDIATLEQMMVTIHAKLSKMG